MPRYTVIGMTMPNGRLAIADVHEGGCTSVVWGSESEGMVRFTHYTVAADVIEAVGNAWRAHAAWHSDRDSLPGATALMSATVTDPGFVDVAPPIEVALDVARAERELREVTQALRRRPWWRRMLRR